MEYTHPDIRVPSHLCGSTAGGLKSLTIDTSFYTLAEGQADLLVLLKTTPLLSRLSISCRCMRERNDGRGINRAECEYEPQYSSLPHLSGYLVHKCGPVLGTLLRGDGFSLEGILHPLAWRWKLFDCLHCLQ